MPHRFLEHLDFARVTGAFLGVAIVSLTSIDLIAKVILTVITVGYICRKWYLLEKRNKEK